MLILTDKSANNIVIHAADEIPLFGEQYFIKNYKVLTENYNRFFVINLPRYYEDGKFTYDPDTGQFTYIKKNAEEIDNWKEIRSQRDLLLQESDTVSHIIWPDKWNSLSDIEKNAWLEYRQALRDIPKNYVHSSNVVWPVKPDFTPVDGQGGVIGST
jgi:hypothetical protein